MSKLDFFVENAENSYLGQMACMVSRPNRLAYIRFARKVTAQMCHRWVCVECSYTTQPLLLCVGLRPIWELLGARLEWGRAHIIHLGSRRGEQRRQFHAFHIYSLSCPWRAGVAQEWLVCTPTEYCKKTINMWTKKQQKQHKPNNLCTWPWSATQQLTTNKEKTTLDYLAMSLMRAKRS